MTATHNHTPLYDQAFTPDNLKHAWARVRSNKGAAGIGGLTLDAFAHHSRAGGRGVFDALRQGRYTPYGKAPQQSNSLFAGLNQLLRNRPRLPKVHFQ